MSYRLWIQSLLKTLGPTLRDPISLAVIASVGVHGLMWVVLPLLPSHSSELEEPEIQRSVALLELTPAEQGRLPDFSPPQVTIPPVPQESDFYSLTPLPNPFSPVPTQPSVPNYRTLPPIVLPQLPPPPQYSFRPPRGLTQRPQTTIPPESPPAEPTPTPSVTPTPPSSPQPNASGDPPSTPGPTQSPGQTPQPLTTDQRIARLQQEQQQIREAYTYNPEATGNGYGQQQSVQWFTEALGRSSDDLDQVPRHELEVAPPRGTCLFQLAQTPGEAWFGVVLNQEGDFIAQPYPIRSSGYKAFDQQALAAIAEYDFSQDAANDKPDFVTSEGEHIYYVQVKFTQPDCSAADAPQGNEG